LCGGILLVGDAHTSLGTRLHTLSRYQATHISLDIRLQHHNESDHHIDSL
jgi:hypothetical protein